MAESSIPASLARRLASGEVLPYRDLVLATGAAPGVFNPGARGLVEPYREALTLTELEGLSQKDAATMLGISVSGMKSRVQRGRRLLRPGHARDHARAAATGAEDRVGALSLELRGRVEDHAGGVLP